MTYRKRPPAEAGTWVPAKPISPELALEIQRMALAETARRRWFRGSDSVEVAERVCRKLEMLNVRDRLVFRVRELAGDLDRLGKLGVDVALDQDVERFQRITRLYHATERELGELIALIDHKLGAEIRSMPP